MSARHARLLLSALTAGVLAVGIAAPVAADDHDARFLLRTDNSGGPANLNFAYGAGDDTAVVGDFNGDGTQTVGVRRGDRYFIRNTNAGGVADLDFHYGRSGDTPVVGDFNGDGTQTVGVRRGDRYFIRNTNAGGVADLDFHYGRSGDTPVVGDFNGDGVETVGVRRGDRFMLRNDNSGGPADLDFRFGRSDDVPLIGDWNGDGVDTVGIRRDGTFHLRFTNTGGPADLTFTYGGDDDIALVGDWVGDGVTTIGVHRRPQPEPVPKVPAQSQWPDVPGTPPADDQVWVDLAGCESNNDWQAVSASGLYYGGLQFHPDTWRSVGGSGLPNEASRAEQIHRAQLLLTEPWATWGNQWPACSQMLGLS